MFTNILSLEAKGKGLRLFCFSVLFKGLHMPGHDQNRFRKISHCVDTYLGLHFLPRPILACLDLQFSKLKLFYLANSNLFCV